MTEAAAGEQATKAAPTSASNMYKHASLTGLGGPLFERNQEATVYVGNLEPRVNEEIIWELFLQAGPIVNVHIPRDKVTNEHQSYGFVEFKAEEDADYSIKILHMVKLFNKPIKVNKASQDKRTQEVGAKIFVGNLSENVDERLLREVFSQFGIVISSEVKRDNETGKSRRYGFVSFDNFDSSDRARELMNGQYLQGKPIDVDYAYKKDNQKEKHGSVSERVLAFCQAQRTAQSSARLAKVFQGNNNGNNEGGRDEAKSFDQYPGGGARKGGAYHQSSTAHHSDQPRNGQNYLQSVPQGMPSLPPSRHHQGNMGQQNRQQAPTSFNPGHGYQHLHQGTAQGYGSGYYGGGTNAYQNHQAHYAQQQPHHQGWAGHQGYQQNQQAYQNNAFYHQQPYSHSGGSGSGQGMRQPGPPRMPPPPPPAERPPQN